MIDELIEFLRGVADNPARAIGPLWLLYWLWSVARSWINRFNQGRAREAPRAPVPKPAPPPKVARPAPRPAPSPRAQERPSPPRKAESRWPALIERAEALRALLLGERKLRWLEPIVVGEVLAPLHAAHARSRSADVETEVERRASGAVLTLQALEHVWRERASDPEAAALFEIDRMAQAAQRPLAEYAQAEDIALVGHAPLAVRFEANRDHYARGLTPRLLFLTVPSGAGSTLSGYTSALQALGRRWFFAFPKLAEQLRDELGLSDQARLVDPRHGFDERSAYAAFGPWLPALFADLALTLRFGNAYVTALRHQVLTAGAAATRARADGAYLSAEPPPLLRLHAALFALQAPSDRNDAERRLAALDDGLPDSDETLLPLADGRHVSLPTTFMVRLTEELAKTVLAARLDALGGLPLSEWPGLSLTLEDARAQASLSRELVQGTARNADAALLLGAAWLAMDQSGDAAAVLGNLRKALAPPVEPARGPAVAIPARKPRSLHAAFRDPRTLRNAVVIGAALAPRRKPSL